MANPTIGGDTVYRINIGGDPCRELTMDGDVVFKLPNGTLDSITNIEDTSAQLEGTVSTMGTFGSINVWSLYRQTGSSSWTYGNSQSVSTTGTVTDTITGLNAETEYEAKFQFWSGGDEYQLHETSAMTFTTASAMTWVDDVANTVHTDAYMDYSSSDPSEFTTSTAWGDQTSESYEVVYTDGTAGVMHSCPDGSGWGSYQNSFLPYYPQPGDTIRVRFRIPHSHDGSYQGTDVNIRFRWGVNGISDRYGIQVSPDLSGSPVYLYDNNGGGGSIDNAEMNTYDAGTVFDFVIDWASDGSSVTADTVEVATGTVHCTVSGSLAGHNSTGIGWRWTDGYSTNSGSTDRSLVDGVWVE